MSCWDFAWKRGAPGSFSALTILMASVSCRLLPRNLQLRWRPPARLSTLTSGMLLGGRARFAPSAPSVFACFYLSGPVAVEKVPFSQQVGYASPWLASDREFPDPLLPRHLSCNLFAVQRMSLSSGGIRSTDMIGQSFMTWEASGGWKAKLPSFIRGDPNALSALLMRYQPFGSSKPQPRSCI